LSEVLVAEAKENSWIVISMKDDCETIFPARKQMNQFQPEKCEN